jgi:UDP-2-acetamido-3-amino-2,3-dideoxy-glucuronate N-acetyltransferase
VVVDRGAHVGLGARVLQGRRIGAEAVVGAGAVVVRDVLPGQIVVGCPAVARAPGAGTAH